MHISNYAGWWIGKHSVVFIKEVVGANNSIILGFKGYLMIVNGTA